ncbi:hypothetical protein BDF20DRAFT_910601 [Mycotypha africana]|uniref:uncharacterized protein n=1 Tax=Mycotypha africana TaxID=64632 RepID=UPI00230180B8|nr:uncharacterized protein BDF20DRAFT_910601 [Mycotypha africana]KAI8988060.1 hypothetical protein BDF20DRAFT_910601 [Mycotypha africana]
MTISFEHFDPEYELGNLDLNGKPIKPRRKPGRKPNPPSPAQRKAQNRAAQRAFRERKRREMKEAEINIKKSMHMRDQALKDIKNLQTKLEELKYENNYLKGQLLTLKIACMAHCINVPKFWDTGSRDRMGSDITTYSRTKDIPQSLEFFLDRNGNIINVDTTTATEEERSSQQLDDNLSKKQQPQQQQQQQHFQMRSSELDPAISLSPTYSFTTTYSSSVTAPELNQPSSVLSEMASQLQQQHLSPLNMAETNRIPMFDANTISDDNIANYIQANPSLTSNLDPTLIEYILQPNIMNDIMSQMKDAPPELWSTLLPPEIAPFIPPGVRSMLPQQLFTDPLEQTMQPPLTIQSQIAHPQPIQLQLPDLPPQYSQQQRHEQRQEQQFKPQQHQTSYTSAENVNSDESYSDIPVEEDFWIDIKKTSSASNKVYVDGPIPPLEAVTRMRTMRDQNDNRYLLTPTELQRKIPHDPRIDLIPGPTMRDYMIIFQDFYNANELFNLLLDSAMFIGGELGNPDCWFVPPGFLRKYWFLCPNSTPTRPDNSVELAVFNAQKMIKLLKRRKEMYIKRDHYPNHFLPPNMTLGDNLNQTTMNDRYRSSEEEVAVSVTTPQMDENNDNSSNYTYQQDQDPSNQQQHLFDNNMQIDVLVINTLNKQDIPRITSPNAFTL